jgi:hypothetical protein
METIGKKGKKGLDAKGGKQNTLKERKRKKVSSRKGE